MTHGANKLHLFQSTHSQGVRSDIDDERYRQNKFQSTLTRSAMTYTDHHIKIDMAFQSTHSQGVRFDVEDYLYGEVDISIHALTRSAIDNHKDVELLNFISIHALTRSAIKYPLPLGDT